MEASIFEIAAVLFIIFLAAIPICGFIFPKKVGHDILGWHKPDDSPKWSDGCSVHSKCKYCGEDIMQDSQGNWF